MKGRVNPKFHSDPAMVFIFKVGFPLMLLLAEVMILPGGNYLMVALPATLLALFYLSAVQVRPGAKTLLTRRFLRWEEIPYEEIRDCKVSFAPGLGALKLNRFVPPWGKMYFVLEGPKLEFARPGGQSSVTRLINARRENKVVFSATESERRHSENQKLSRSKSSLIGCGVAFLVGAAYFFILNKWFPNAIHRIDPRDFPIMAAVQRFQEALLHWPWNLAAGFVLVGVIVVVRSNTVWPFAFVLGGLVGTITARGLF